MGLSVAPLQGDPSHTDSVHPRPRWTQKRPQNRPERTRHPSQDHPGGTPSDTNMPQWSTKNRPPVDTNMPQLDGIS